jgi:hypothetical protein
VDGNVVRNRGVEGWLLGLLFVIPQFVDSLEGLLRHLDPDTDVVRTLSFGDWKRK